MVRQAGDLGDRYGERAREKACALSESGVGEWVCTIGVRSVEAATGWGRWTEGKSCAWINM